ncbi:MAG: hypothetical protein QM764_17330 [Chitinophagaceae bacterium]
MHHSSLSKFKIVNHTSQIAFDLGFIPFFVNRVSDIVSIDTRSFPIFATYMCSYQTLYHNDRTGYVIRCEECSKIQVAYGNLVMTFEKCDFEAFHKWIGNVHESQQPVQSPAVRSIMIPSPCQGMRLLLSYNELKELNTMLDEADTELQSLELIQLFE